MFLLSITKISKLKNHPFRVLCAFVALVMLSHCNGMSVEKSDGDGSEKKVHSFRQTFDVFTDERAKFVIAGLQQKEIGQIDNNPIEENAFDSLSLENFNLPESLTVNLEKGTGDWKVPSDTGLYIASFSIRNSNGLNNYRWEIHVHDASPQSSGMRLLRPMAGDTLRIGDTITFLWSINFDVIQQGIIFSLTSNEEQLFNIFPAGANLVTRTSSLYSANLGQYLWVVPDSMGEQFGAILPIPRDSVLFRIEAPYDLDPLGSAWLRQEADGRVTIISSQ